MGLHLDIASTCWSYYEEFSSVPSAIAREKELKGWRRDKKLALILAEKPGLGRSEPGVGRRSVVVSGDGVDPSLRSG
jgi:hypothetical protein